MEGCDGAGPGVGVPTPSTPVAGMAVLLGLGASAFAGGLVWAGAEAFACFGTGTETCGWEGGSSAGLFTGSALLGDDFLGTLHLGMPSFGTRAGDTTFKGTALAAGGFWVGARWVLALAFARRLCTLLI